MRPLIILLLSILPLIGFAQNSCSFFVPNTSYTEGKAPDLKIELIQINKDYFIKVTPSKKDNPFTFTEKISFEFFIKNDSKISFSVADTEKKSDKDTNGEIYTTYLYKPTRVETAQLKLGIIGIIYIEPFPGSIIGYNPIGGC